MGAGRRRRLLALAAPALLPPARRSQTIPIIAIAPLLIIWFGFGLLPKVVVIALVTFFPPVAIGLVEGFSSADREASNLVRSMGADRWGGVPLPAAARRDAVVLHLAADRHHLRGDGCGVRRVRRARAGLGIFMNLQKNSFRTDLVLAAVVVTAAISVGLFGLTFLVQRLAMPGTPRSAVVREVRVEGG